MNNKYEGLCISIGIVKYCEKKSACIETEYKCENGWKYTTNKIFQFTKIDPIWQIS